MKLYYRLVFSHILLTIFLFNSLILKADNSKPIFDIVGITYGFDLSTFKGYPRNPYNGTPLTLTTVPDLRKKDDLSFKAKFYDINLNLYGSLIGSILMKKEKFKLIIGDYSEVGLGMGYARVMSLDENIKKEFGNTVGISANLGTGIIVGYKIKSDIFASIKYQWIIDQYFAAFESTNGNTLHRTRIAGTIAFKKINASINIARPWGLKEDKTMNIIHQNKGFGFEFKYRLENNKIVGLKYNRIKIRYKDLDNDPIPYWERNYSGLQIFAGIAF